MSSSCSSRLYLSTTDLGIPLLPTHNPALVPSLTVSKGLRDPSSSDSFRSARSTTPHGQGVFQSHRNRLGKAGPTANKRPLHRRHATTRNNKPVCPRLGICHDKTTGFTPSFAQQATSLDVVDTFESCWLSRAQQTRHHSKKAKTSCQKPHAAICECHAEHPRNRDGLRRLAYPHSRIVDGGIRAVQQ
ncbi:uncharacterized protein LY79DRAFT_544641 [Colletotrichum navitas]|uniref:Uncharacterized protein n=1 Tax=Colletotrichum navitas TaxID=681940 RepID=A0AAD8V7Z1_9PEZI|nr:uncharacterized protein LY79DRAFT_544641 [Colletotrichum navitas]KAK1596389.1 hypothetical protein LY79DRAFT_544641 [Colletotrichum navitas]